MWKNAKKWENYEAWFGGHKGYFSLVLGLIKKLTHKLEIAVRPIEPLASLMCKAQLLLKVSLHLLDNEIKLLDKRYVC
jgi:hypothetical protein